MKIKFKTISLVSLIIVLLLGLVYWVVISNRPEGWLDRSKKELEIIVSFAEDLDDDSALLKDDYWDVNNPYYYAFNNPDKSQVKLTKTQVQINDSEVVNAIDLLFSRGYNSISIRGNTIVFLKNAWLEYGCGLAYSVDASGELDIQYLTNKVQLEESNWYYYESDYNEWRVQNNER